ncbi:hypothetical protein SS50377_26585 [Spironucleus salmonicida]|uniref:Uncharacterized protein n=1 Tax=Spironucleus salmonicida TaxID=348837 RepID=V6LB29_9EUKA|nr:hypothetical protein SS50377_26585 [Spironucleus salmonicida]|eukprot:EST41438.1 Hypothetical protein SS50377_19155 [Spironucleus salmonicida]
MGCFESIDMQGNPFNSQIEQHDFISQQGNNIFTRNILMQDNQANQESQVSLDICQQSTTTLAPLSRVQQYQLRIHNDELQPKTIIKAALLYAVQEFSDAETEFLEEQENQIKQGY